MKINEEAIVAGAKAMDAYWGGRYAPDEVEELRGEVTAMLEAAAPIIRAEAIQAAADVLAGEDASIWTKLYDKFAEQDGGELSSDSAAYLSGVAEAMHFLRARAVAERGGQ